MIKQNQKKLPRNSHFLFLPLAADAQGGIPTEIQLLPFGNVQSEKGPFRVDNDAIAQIMQAFNSKKNDLVIDYEHQTLTGDEAPAAGWIKELINKGKDGLWAKVEWTPRGIEYLQNKEYKYFSPVILVRKSDNRAVKIHSGALTNTPAIDGMEPIVNSAGVENDPESEALNMILEELLKKLAGILGLPESATADEICQAVANCAKKPMANKEILAVLQLPETANQEAFQAAVVSLKNTANLVAHPELLTMLQLSANVSLTEAKAKIMGLTNPGNTVNAEEFKALKDKLAAKERDELVEFALSTGKITPAQKPWAMQQAEKDPESFRLYLSTAAQVVPLDKLPNNNPPAKDPLTDDLQLSVNKQLGIEPEDFKKYNK